MKNTNYGKIITYKGNAITTDSNDNVNYFSSI